MCEHTATEQIKKYICRKEVLGELQRAEYYYVCNTYVTYCIFHLDM